jgi:trimeric autotransporter adhesin
MDDGRTEDVTARAAWSSSDPSVATVSTTGVVTAYAAGVSTITAEADGVASAAHVSVG